jgi:hypothetical protein
MSEDAHNSDNLPAWTPKEFDEWRKSQQFEFEKATKLLRSMVVKPKSAVATRIPAHLGRWEELTIEDFKFLYDCGVSCE